MRAALVLLLLSVGFSVFSQTKEPVKINVPEADAQKMDAEEHSLVELLKGEIEKHLNRWVDFQMDPPTSVFEPGAVAIRFEDLFKSPTSDEVAELAKDEHGQPLRISAAQLEQIREEGLLVIPSRLYPGQNHVWKIAAWVQHGRQQISVKLNKSLSSAFDQIVVEIPERMISPSPVSARHGINMIWKAVKSFGDKAVGLIQMQRKYSDEQLRRELVAEAAQRGKTTLDELFSQESTGRQISSAVSRISNELDQAWSEEQDKLAEELISQMKDLPPAEAIPQIRTLLERTRIEQFYEMLRNDEGLKSIGNDLGELLVRRDRAARLALASESLLNSEIEQKMETAKSELQRDWRYRIPTWQNGQLKKLEAKIRQEARETQIRSLIETLNQEGLKEEANALQTAFNYFVENKATFGSEKAKELMAQRSEELHNQIYLSWKWHAEQRRAPNGNTYYALVSYNTSTVDSSVPGWRIWLAAERWYNMMKNYNYHLIVTNLWNGPVGLKSLVLPNEYAPWTTVDQTTGQLIEDKSRMVQTTWSLHKKIWASVRDAKIKYDLEDNKGFLHAPLRPVYRGLTNAKGAAMTAFLWLGKPVATGVNGVSTLLLSGTSLAWTGALSLLDYGYDWVIRDTTKESRRADEFSRLAIFGQGFFALGGLAETTGSVLMLAGHPIIAAAQTTGAGVRAGAYSVWDQLMAYIFIKRADLPASDSRTMRRISGPGLASQYYFQITPEVATVALQAQMERLELDAYTKSIEIAIAEPEQKMKSFLGRTLGALGFSEPQRAEWYQEVVAGSDKVRKEVRERLNERYKELPKVSEDNRTRGRLRLTQADLDRTLQLARPIVESIYNTRLKTLLAGDTAEFWHSRGLAENDYEGLTKRLLVETFGQEFMGPLESVDQSFVIHVNSPEYSNLLAKILDGQGLKRGDVTIDGEIQTPPATVTIPYTSVNIGSLRRVSLTSLCDGQLAGL